MFTLGKLGDLYFDLYFRTLKGLCWAISTCSIDFCNAYLKFNGLEISISEMQTLHLMIRTNNSAILLASIWKLNPCFTDTEIQKHDPSSNCIFILQ